MTRLYEISLVVTLCALLTRAVSAQTEASSGQVAGRVVDSSGTALAGVRVTVSSTATAMRRDKLTDAQGLYAVPLLPSGTYDLLLERNGFRNLHLSGMKVTVGSALAVDFVMEPGAASEAVTVTSGALPLNVTSPVPTTTFDADFLSRLPTNGRRFQDLLVVTPNAQVDIQRGQLALSGQRGINANISIDGVDYNEPFFGGIRGGSRSNFAPTIPQEAIREFQVVASGYSPEFGRSSGGIVNVVTRAGSNQMSGAGFYLIRPADLASNNAFGQQAAPTQQQWGGSLGGPIRRGRLFYFLSYEQQNVNVPRAVLFDALQNFSPTVATQEAFDHFKSLEEPYTETNDAVAVLGRLDWQAASSARFDVRYSGSRNIGLNAITPGNAAFPTVDSALSHNGTEKDRVDTLVGQFTDVWRPDLLFEVRGQYSREARPREANAIEPRVVTSVGRFGTVSFLGRNDTVDWRGQAATAVTRIAGGHTLKAGADFNYVFLDQTVGLNQTGFFMVSGSDTAAALQVLSTGAGNRFDSSTVRYSLQIGDLELSMPTTEAAVFFQDSWRTARGLTLTYGLRWEGQWLPTPDASNSSLVDRLAGFVFPSGRQVDPTTIPDAPAQFSPRGGFAWDPGQDGRTVVRGHAGVYFARSPGIIFANPLSNFGSKPADLSVQLPFTVPENNPNKTVYQQLALIGIDLNQRGLDDLPILSPAQLTEVAGALGLEPNSSLGAQPFVVDSDFKNPKSYHWGVGVERVIRGGITVGAEYSDVRTVNLERNIDLNLPFPVVRPTDLAERPFFGLRSGTSRPIPSLGQVTVRESTARSQLRGLTLTTRLKKPWGEASVHYVLSKSRSDDDNEADVGGMVAENAYNLTPEYSFARLDRRHQLSGAWALLLPYGMELAGSFQFRSGLPIDVITGATDPNQDLSNGPDRPYRAAGVPFERNLFRNRSTSSVDLRVLKGVSIGGGRRMSIVLDAFNLFNAANIQYAGNEVRTYCKAPVPATCGFDPPSNPNFLQLYDSNPESDRFGDYLLNNVPGEPRQIQLGVRFSF